MRNRLAAVVCSFLALLLVGATQMGEVHHAVRGVAPTPTKPIEYVEWKRSAPPAWLEAAEEDDLDSVRAQLSTIVKLRCEGKPLIQALKLVEAQIDTRIVMNTQELGFAGIDPDSPVTVETSGKLKDVLERMLEAVENADAGLTWRLLPSGIQITSRENADAEPELRTFDLTYFLPDGSHSDELMNLIVQHIDPDSWVLAGGTNVISHFGSQLVVSAPSSTMQRIEKLLAKIAKQDRDHLKAPKFKEDKPESKEEASEASTETSENKRE